MLRQFRDPHPLSLYQNPKLDLHLDGVHLNVTFPIFLNKRFSRDQTMKCQWYINMSRDIFIYPPPLTPKLDLHLNEVHLNVTFPMFWNKRFLGTKQWNVSDYQIFFYKYVTWHIYMLRQFRDPSPLDLPIPEPPTWLALK